jgi:D-alanine transaminase
MDRGFLFADGIYEVSAVIDGALIDNDGHLDRLDRSLAAVRIANPYARPGWVERQIELVRRNALAEGLVYMQVTRGVAERDFPFPKEATPTVVMFTQSKRIIDAPLATSGAKVVTVQDIRWARRDIKSLALLAQVLAKQEAAEAGVAEAFMVQEDGTVTEGASSTAFIITPGKALITRPLSTRILPGITRQAILKLAARHALTIEERPFTVAEALDALEVFFTSASSLVMPVIAIDGHPIGQGRPGPLATALRTLYIDIARGRDPNA